MQVLTSTAEARSACKALRSRSGSSLGLVPTMGALHEGHLSLIRAARRTCDHVIATIFVNPLQFGPTEDLSQYPRTFSQDCALLDAEGVDLLFAPSPQMMYPSPTQTWVELPEIGSRLDGASRPGHFRGVATVVAKLFNIVHPDRAFFGQKDAAQVAVLRTMVHDLNFELELVVCPIVRDQDGLALSSRNRYLSSQERTTALALSRSLQQVELAIAQGTRSIASLRDMLHEHLRSTVGLRVDYAEIVDRATLDPVLDLRNGALVAVAAWVGNTRLIDNLEVPREEPA